MADTKEDGRLGGRLVRQAGRGGQFNKLVSIAKEWRIVSPLLTATFDHHHREIVDRFRWTSSGAASFLGVGTRRSSRTAGLIKMIYGPIGP